MDKAKKIRELRESTGMNRKEFCDYFLIPYRTVTEWERNGRHAPDYLIRLLEYYIRTEKLDKKEISIRGLNESEITEALELAWKVFLKFESPDYSKEGTEEFKKCLHDEKYLSGIEYYGAFFGEKLIGMIGIRTDRKHICFCFVDGKYHRMGVGRRMFEYMYGFYSNETITLNSSPYGVPFYKAIGFVPTDEEQTVNGIRFTPMKYNH